MSEPIAGAPRPSVASMLLGSGPRFARDAVLPPLAFYVAFKISGLTAGVLAATLASAAIWGWERRRARTGIGASIGLAIAASSALAGLTTGSAVAFFAPGVAVNVIYGLAFFVSVLLGRPLAGVFAGETYPFPPAVKASATYRRVFSRVSIAWGSYFVVRSAIRVLALAHGDVDVIVAVNVVTGVPFTAALTTWSVWYGVRGFRRSTEWGRALRAATIVLIAASLAGPAMAGEADDLVRAADSYRRPADSFAWKITITSQEAKKAPSTDGFEVFVKDRGRSLVKFIAPPRNVGRSLLALNRDLWIYLPDAGKPVRIPFSQRLVGQVANGDVARADYAGDYDATLLGEETAEGVPCHVLDLKAKTKDVTYAGVKYWVARDGRRPVKAEFYAATGTLLKTGTFEAFKEVVPGHVLATKLTLVDGIRKDKLSVLDYGSIVVRDIPEKYFDKNSMKSLD